MEKYKIRIYDNVPLIMDPIIMEWDGCIRRNV